jgi:glycosyltransferase involved in cell wall biosynthesis
LKVAYIVSRFPKVTETFVLYELLELERLGVAVEVFPLLRQREAVQHAEAAGLVSRAHYEPFLSWEILGAIGHYLWRRPGVFLRTVATVLARTIASPNFFFGALATLPKTTRFARVMEQSGVDHVHSHFANHPALAAFVVHRLTGIPYSFTAHGSDLHVDQTALDLKLGDAAFAVTVSAYNRQFVLDRVGRDLGRKMVVLHCGVDAGLLAPSEGGGNGEFRILCVAALREVKGHRHLIEACRLLAQRGMPFRCELVGDGPLAGALRKQVRDAGLEGRVVLRGALPRHGVVECMRRASVVVQPSAPDREGRREGIPVALMEAMSVGLPVVTSRLSGIPELVEDGASGLLTEPGDARGIAEALEKLAASPELRARLGRRGRERVLADFDLRRSVGELARMFRQRGAPLPEEKGVPVPSPST